MSLISYDEDKQSQLIGWLFVTCHDIKIHRIRIS